MAEDLEPFVLDELAKRRGQWRKIAAAVPGCSYSWMQKFASRSYKSSPSHARLVALAKHLRETEAA